MGSSKKIVSGVIWSVLLNFVQAVYGFISVPILIHYFGKAEYGLIGLACSVNVYIQLMDMGLSSTNVRYFSVWLAEHNMEKVRKLFETDLAFYGVVGIINAVIILMLYLFSSSIFNVTPEQDIILKNLLIVLAVTAVVSWISSCFDQLISGTENVAWLKKRALIPKLVMCLVLFLVVFFKLDITTYFILTMIASFIVLPLTISKIKKEIPDVRFIPKLDKDVFKEILPYSLNIFSFGIFQFSFTHLRPVFLGIQGLPENVADYNVLNGLAGLVGMVGGVFMSVLLPSSSRVVAEGNKEAYYKVAYRGTKYISTIYCLCVFGLMTIGRDLLSVYVGEDFLYLVFWLNMWIILLLGGHNHSISSLILSGTNIRPLTYSSAIASIGGLVVTWFCIPDYGVGGAVLGMLFYTLVQQCFFYFYFWPKRMQIDSWKVFSRSFSPYVIAGLACYMICAMLPHSSNHWVNIFSYGGLFAVLYLLFVFFSFDKEDKAFALSFLKRK